jgi:hypothetical protein
MVAEGVELETNLLQVSQRNQASPGVLDEVFGTHREKVRGNWKLAADIWNDGK